MSVLVWINRFDLIRLLTSGLYLLLRQLVLLDLWRCTEPKANSWRFLVLFVLLIDELLDTCLLRVGNIWDVGDWALRDVRELVIEPWMTRSLFIEACFLIIGCFALRLGWRNIVLVRGAHILDRDDLVVVALFDILVDIWIHFLHGRYTLLWSIWGHFLCWSALWVLKIRVLLIIGVLEPIVADLLLLLPVSIGLLLLVLLLVLIEVILIIIVSVEVVALDLLTENLRVLLAFTAFASTVVVLVGVELILIEVFPSLPTRGLVILVWGLFLEGWATLTSLASFSFLSLLAWSGIVILVVSMWLVLLLIITLLAKPVSLLRIEVIRICRFEVLSICWLRWVIHKDFLLLFALSAFVPLVEAILLELLHEILMDLLLLLELVLLEFDITESILKIFNALQVLLILVSQAHPLTFDALDLLLVFLHLKWVFLVRFDLVILLNTQMRIDLLALAFVQLGEDELQDFDSMFTVRQYFQSFSQLLILHDVTLLRLAFRVGRILIQAFACCFRVVWARGES